MQKRYNNNQGVKREEQFWCEYKNKYVKHSYYEAINPIRKFARLCIECDKMCSNACKWNMLNK